ncbi:abscisic stress-ripening protein 1-like, partial [Prunus avium]|uniref:Abscisic stress-ripening protein 1-like n=1 Tax=Prunus avium TaxID=42229 RepID=A0A6P5RKA9_PRUAV
RPGGVGGFGKSADYSDDGPRGSRHNETAAYVVTATHESEIDYKKEEKHHKNLEHLGEGGVAAAGVFALNEKHRERKDPEQAHRHKIEEEVAAAAAVGSGGFAFHEHHEKKETKEEEKDSHGK